ncbi:HEPN domain-containing protein [bacterium]|nr:HEPN domain-containing protein [bacterium]MBU1152639.1 HEPN domain-containing protein [bacterium]MBU1782884.1 HEPN domain-containing protein [bacterium]MBU2600437.1 HEPN domain-containing protein [bacterium]
MKDKEFVLEWLKRAKSHLARARMGKTSEEVLYEDLCFDCQQAVEKTIKALLISRNKKFPWTHSIAKLLELVLEEGIEIPDKVKMAIDLTDYAVRTRYPGEIEPVDEEEYEEALILAEDVYNWADKLILDVQVF